MTRYEKMYYKMRELEGTRAFKTCHALCACTGCVTRYGIGDRYFEMYKSGELKRIIISQGIAIKSHIPRSPDQWNLVYDTKTKDLIHSPNENYF